MPGRWLPPFARRLAAEYLHVLGQLPDEYADQMHSKRPALESSLNRWVCPATS